MVPRKTDLAKLPKLALTRDELERLGCTEEQLDQLFPDPKSENSSPSE